MKSMIRQSRESALAKEKSESMMEKVEEREREGKKEEHTVRGRVFISCTEPIVAAFSHPGDLYGISGTTSKWSLHEAEHLPQ